MTTKVVLNLATHRSVHVLCTPQSYRLTAGASLWGGCVLDGYNADKPITKFLFIVVEVFSRAPNEISAGSPTNR